MSKTLTKTGLAKQTAQGLSLTQIEAMNAIETIADLITCHFQNGGEVVTIRGFGTFRKRKRRAFTGSDPRTGEPVAIPERYSVTFKPSADVVRRINI
jgi:nucleoid DNA-binding protein